ncbi:hypothetical protein ACFCWD_19045 [Streptomyces sp. NPDC056374]|uniref:hypothetical protein n=1 Tax=unclassified Streptomyces TaxID=2593676 RepID=UPI0035DCF375
MNNSACGTSRTAPRPMSAWGIAVVIVVVVAAALLAYAGWQVISVIVLSAEVAALSLRVMRRLHGAPRPTLGISGS